MTQLDARNEFSELERGHKRIGKDQMGAMAADLLHGDLCDVRAIRQIDNRLGVDRAAAAEGGLRQLPDGDSVDAKHHQRTATLVVVVAAVNVATRVVDASRQFDAHRSQRIICITRTIGQHAAVDAECHRRSEHLRQLRLEAGTSRANRASRTIRARRTSLTSGTDTTSLTRGTDGTGRTGRTLRTRRTRRTTRALRTRGTSGALLTRVTSGALRTRGTGWASVTILAVGTIGTGRARWTLGTGIALLTRGTLWTRTGRSGRSGWTSRTGGTGATS